MCRSRRNRTYQRSSMALQTDKAGGRGGQSRLSACLTHHTARYAEACIRAATTPSLTALERRAATSRVDTQGIALVQSSEVLEFCGALPQGAWLYPSGFADEVRDRVAWYDAKLGTFRHWWAQLFNRLTWVRFMSSNCICCLSGPHTRRWGYHQILPNRHLGFELMSVGVGGMERQLGRLAYPLIVRFIRKGLNITPQKAEESLRRVEAVFDEVADVSEDGYIVGGSFTAADLTFASLASMALLPPEHPSGLPQPEDGSLAADVASEIQRLRATHGGRHALRMYREHRHTRPGGV